MNEIDIDSAIKSLSKSYSYESYLQVAKSLESNKLSSFVNLRIALLRNFTIEPLIPVIKGEAALSGFKPELYLGGYDLVANDVLNPKSKIFEFKPQVIFLFQWLETLAPGLTSKFPTSSSTEASNQIEGVVNDLFSYISSIRNVTNAPIILSNFVLPPVSALGILDAQSEDSQINSIWKLNSKILETARKFDNVFILDVMTLMARIGTKQGLDYRFWEIARAPLSHDALIAIGREFGKFLRALFGRTRKCLVLDCDNVLWNGIVGEDGIKTINIAFQQEVLNLHEKGVLLALCSKNNEIDVLDVLRTNPDMLLKEHHFATHQINWEDKVTNLLKIAQTLNIGVDSLVFLDDSEFECDLVREQLPQVTTMCMQGGSSGFRLKLQEQGFFDSLSFSEEDRFRNQMYQNENQRKAILTASKSLDDYLAGLDMHSEIGQVSNQNIPRISQLTQKTNQFNLTTHRYTESDIRRMLIDPDIEIFYLNLKDKISDIGLVGVAIVKLLTSEAHIDTFLLSCRALGRGVEYSFLGQLVEMYRAKGYECIIGQYKPTERNLQVANFYQDSGFVSTDKNTDSELWKFDLKNSYQKHSGWIKTTMIGSS